LEYNLGIFDQAIGDILNNLDNSTGKKAELNSYYYLLKTESIKIKLSIKNDVFRLKSNIEIEHYINKQQLALENLVLLVVKEINPTNPEDLYVISTNCAQINNLKIIYRKLEKLQLFIEAEYFNYLNGDKRIPYRSLIEREKEIYPKVIHIREIITSINLSYELSLIVFESLNLNIQENITYNQFNYYKEFIAELHQLLNILNESVSEENITSFLIELNYNSKSFFNHQLRKIVADLNKITSHKDKIDYLLRTTKTYNQINCISFLYYKPKFPSHKEQIINWLEAEITYLNKTYSLENSNQLNLPTPDYKIKILSGFSVAQLSYFFNLLEQVGIISHKNKRDIFRFIAGYFRTSQTETISADSVSAKYYNVETSTKEAVKSKIIDLLNIVKR
jgi:tRNA U38,U39,U40 pseudouridine synthase TruA